jgi:predicted kinase
MITVVTGAPCSGKSTFIDERCKPGDIVIDMDRLALALSPVGTEPYEFSDKVRAVARSARAAAVKSALSVAQGERYLGVWIIHTDPSPADRMVYRSANSQFVEMNTSKAVCLERLKSRPVKSQLVARKVIDEYFAKR